MEKPMTKHTPGPWETSSNAEGQWDVCKDYAGDMIADLKGTDNQEANARLIAKAPEMLDCLQELESTIAHWRRWGQADLGRFQAAYDQIRAILNALEG